MGNFCSTARADQGLPAGGVLTLGGGSGAKGPPAQAPEAAQATQQPAAGDAPRAPTAAQVADEAQVCTGSKLEQLAVEYLSKEVGSDRAVHGQTPSSANVAQGTVVEDVEAVEEKHIRWQQGELIGAGAFGRVYLGLNLDTGQLMAVKQVSVAKDETNMNLVTEHVRSLEAEVNVLKQLHHPNIVRYMGTERGKDRMSLNIFLEFVPGGSIASLLAKFGCFTESVLRVYTKQILVGLEFLHTHQIMHRDIKGANILVDNTGVIKLADFGASKKIEDLVTMDSGFKSIKGTPYWMAPEVIKQTGHGRQADIWSVGCTVIEMATGKPPWSQFAAPVSALFHIASSKGPPPLPEHLSPEAKDFLLLCFNRSPKDRPNASRLLEHPFLTTAISVSTAAPSKIPASTPAATPARPPQPRPAPPSVTVPQAPPPEFGTGFRYVPTKPLTPVVEASTPVARTQPEDDTALGQPRVSESGSDLVFAGGNTVARDDPMMESVAFSVDSAMSSVSYNPIEEPSWLQSMDNPMDPSTFMTPEGLPPPQPHSLYGKENKGPRRMAANLPSASNKNKSLAPIEPSAPPEIRGDEENIMQYVREKAVRETVRLSTPFLETKALAPPPGAEASGSSGPQVLSLETSTSPQVLRLDGPSPKPMGGRRVGRPVRPSQGTASERMSKSQQWKEELEKELQEKRLIAKTPREPDGPGGFHRQFSRER